MFSSPGLGCLRKPPMLSACTNPPAGMNLYILKATLAGVTIYIFILLQQATDQELQLHIYGIEAC